MMPLLPAEDVTVPLPPLLLPAKAMMMSVLPLLPLLLPAEAMMTPLLPAQAVTMPLPSLLLPAEVMMMPLLPAEPQVSVEPQEAFLSYKNDFNMYHTRGREFVWLFFWLKVFRAERCT